MTHQPALSGCPPDHSKRSIAFLRLHLAALRTALCSAWGSLRSNRSSRSTASLSCNRSIKPRLRPRPARFQLFQSFQPFQSFKTSQPFDTAPRAYSGPADFSNSVLIVQKAYPPSRAMASRPASVVLYRCMRLLGRGPWLRLNILLLRRSSRRRSCSDAGVCDPEAKFFLAHTHEKPFDRIARQQLQQARPLSRRQLL